MKMNKSSQLDEDNSTSSPNLAPLAIKAWRVSEEAQTDEQLQRLNHQIVRNREKLLDRARANAQKLIGRPTL